MSPPTSRALLASACAALLLLLLPLLAGCDFDSAWQGWCNRTGCNNPDAGPDEICRNGSVCPAQEICVHLEDGANCMHPCTGYPGACGTDFDCKLVPDRDDRKFVPACVRAGAGTGQCFWAEDCAEGLTCDSAGVCVEMCSPYHPDCTPPAGADAGAPRCVAEATLPDDWGLCRP
ncbi:MAG TPA: hypothetical protein VGK67_33665 [Myxococcales bacterium]